MITKKKILIIGRNSFVAKHLIGYFKTHNEVEAIGHDGFLWDCNRPDIVINCACPISPPRTKEAQDDILTANSLLMYDIVDYCESKEAMLLHLSSKIVLENTQRGDRHYIYAMGKKFAEALCYTYNEIYGLDVRVVRFGTIYGRYMPLDNDRKISKVVKDYRESGIIQNDLVNPETIFIDDLVSGIETIIERGQGGRAYNIPFGDDIRSLGWIPKVAIEDGLKQTI